MACIIFLLVAALIFWGVGFISLLQYFAARVGKDNQLANRASKTFYITFRWTMILGTIAMFIGVLWRATAGG